MKLIKTHKLKSLPVEERIWALLQDLRPRTPNLSPHWEARQVLIAHLLAVRFTSRALQSVESGYPSSDSRYRLDRHPNWVAHQDLPPRLQNWLESRRVPLRTEPVIDTRHIEHPLCFVYALTDLQPLMPRGLGVDDLFEMDLLQIANTSKLTSRVLLSLVLLALDQTAGGEADSLKVRIQLARHCQEMRRPDPPQAKAWGVDHLLARFLGPLETSRPDDANGAPGLKTGSSARMAASENARKSAANTNANISTPSDAKAPAVAKPVPPGMVRWSICQASAAQERRGAMSADSKRNERQSMLDSLAERPQRDRPLAQAYHADAVEALRVCFPNFSGVLDLIVPHIQLQVRLGAPLQLPPLLMLGSAGVGKTHFARRLAQALDGELEIRDLSGTTAGFVITGNASTWADAQPGCIARLLERMADGKTPMVFFDELDKARVGNFPPDQVLLSLLEPTSAARFRDEHLDLELDARPISYLLACNRVENIRPELLSRVQVIEVPRPSPEQMPAIIRSVDEELRRENLQMVWVFLPLSDELIESLPILSPRQLRSVLMTTYARAGQRTQGQGDGVRVLLEDLANVFGSEKGSRPAYEPLIDSLICTPSIWRIH